MANNKKRNRHGEYRWVAICVPQTSTHYTAYDSYDISEDFWAVYDKKTGRTVQVCDGRKEAVTEARALNARDW